MLHRTALSGDHPVLTAINWTTIKTKTPKAEVAIPRSFINTFRNPPYGEIVLIMYLLFIASLLVPFASAIWPVPVQYSLGNSTVVLAKTFTIEFNGPTGKRPSGYVDTSKKVSKAINRTYTLLNDSFIPNMLFQFETDFEPSAAAMAAAPVLSKLVVHQR